jgi:hypothetical protein
MLATRLIRLIETHSQSLTRETMQDVLTNERTRSFHRVPKAELEPRVAALYENLGKWIGDPSEAAVKKEYEYWGTARFHQEIPLNEIVYCVILTKKHLRRFIREHGLIAFANDRATPDELVPVELYGIQELNYMVGEFFDKALYYLALGYEMAAKKSQVAARA